jgi:hypothetical protein
MNLEKEKKQAKSGGLFFCGARNTGDVGNFNNRGGKQKKVKKINKSSNNDIVLNGKNLRFPIKQNPLN